MPISVWAGRALALREDQCPGREAVRVGRTSGLSYGASILRERFLPGGRRSAVGSRGFGDHRPDAPDGSHGGRDGWVRVASAGLRAIVTGLFVRRSGLGGMA